MTEHITITYVHQLLIRRSRPSFFFSFIVFLFDYYYLIIINNHHRNRIHLQKQHVHLIQPFSNSIIINNKNYIESCLLRVIIIITIVVNRGLSLTSFNNNNNNIWRRKKYLIERDFFLLIDQIFGKYLKKNFTATNIKKSALYSVCVKI